MQVTNTALNYNSTSAATNVFETQISTSGTFKAEVRGCND